MYTGGDFMKPFFLITLSLICCLLCSTLPASQAANRAAYYVAPGGDDAWPGTVTQPWGTLAHAIDQLGAGDVLYVRGGIHTVVGDGIYIDPYPEGTPTARVTITAFPGESPRIECATDDDESCLVVGGDHVVINGLEIANARRTGLTVWEASHVHLTNNTIHHTQRGGIWVGGSDWGTVSDIVIEGNTIYRTCQINNPPPPGSGGGWPAAIGSSYVEGLVVRDNLVYENFGEGIAFTIVNNGLAAGNVLHDNYSLNMYMDNATNSRFEGNLTYTTYDEDFYRFGEPSTNIQMANEDIYDTSNPINNNTVINNILIGGRYGFHYGNYLAGGGLKNVTIANNTIYNAAWAAIAIDDDAGHENSLVVNNLIYQLDGNPLVVQPSTDAVSFRHNLWYGGDPGDAVGPGDVVGNPHLAQPGGILPEDYWLMPHSPARDAGDAALLALAPLDFFGVSRPQSGGMDIGAHEVPGRGFFLPCITR
jgi:hypothetical protein